MTPFVYLFMENLRVSFKNMIGGYKGNFVHDDLLRWIGEILDVLSFLTKKGIVHGDIKPDNTTVNEDGALKLIDFDAPFSMRNGATGCYTGDDCAPEYWLTYQIDTKCEVWAAAATFYSLIYTDLP
ncbi:spindle assembly checkpoint kinase-like [Tetranychus urticae]|uniref:spindle assembly checkpoint kinase-like n=1 Tax=Tetranychus urticae TaxID=32264 RepID=UPI00077BC711|nr:spindle assembly checkpoint kinase-like [Tetranychus urticae]